MSDLLTAAHTQTTKLPTYQVVRALNQHLGTTLVAYMANVRSRQLPGRWATDPSAANHTEPRDEAKQRLQLAHEVFIAIEKEESEHVARQWLMGANPRFDGQSPAERIREFDAGAVYGALKAFLGDVTGG